jgi:hypothetical protein
MDKAAKEGDPTQTPITIADWLLFHQGINPVCLNCGQVVTAKALYSPTVVPHFAHRPGVMCPLVQRTTLFASMQRLPHGDLAIQALKDAVRKKIARVHATAEVVCPALTWLEFLAALKKATELDVWRLRHMTPRFMAYVVLACHGVFPARSFRLNPIYFVLDANVGQPSYWSKQSPTKKHVWRVTEIAGPKGTTSSIEKIPMASKLSYPWYTDRVESAMK